MCTRAPQNACSALVCCRLPSRVEYLSPQGVLLPLVYGTTASPLIEAEEEALKGFAVLFFVICCLALRGLAFQIRQFAISALVSEASSGDDDYTDPKAAVSIARPRNPKASRLDAQNVLILCTLFLLVSECSEAVCNCNALHCFMSRIARPRNRNRKMIPFYSILETTGVKSSFSS